MLSSKMRIYLIVLVLLFIIFDKNSYANDFLKFMNSLQVESFKENKELSDLLKNYDFKLGINENNVRKKYNFDWSTDGFTKNALLDNEEIKIKTFSDLKHIENISIKVFGFRKEEEMKSPKRFLGAVLRADKDYLFSLTKEVAVDDFDTDLGKISSDFIKKYGSPDFISGEQRNSDMFALLYTIKYDNKPSIFMAKFRKSKNDKKEEGSRLIFEMIDLSFAEFNKDGSKLKKAF